MAKKKYNPKYYLSEIWLKQKQLLIEWRGNKCEHCGSEKNLQIHHRNYETFGEELPFDLLILCKECHEKLHQLAKKVLNGEVWQGGVPSNGLNI